MTKRTRGQGYPEGEVKLHILIYVDQKEDAKYEDVRLSVEHKYGKMYTSGLRKHLKDLEKDRVLSVKKMEHKHNNLYFLPKGFDAFKRLFNYFKKYGREKEFMCTLYFSNYIRSDDFHRKYLINLINENASVVINYLNNLEEKGQHPQYTKIARIKNDFFNFYNNINSVNFSPSNRIDDFYSNYVRQYLHDDISTTLPDKNEINMINMLKVSPNAIDFMLNSEYKNPVLISSVTEYFISVLDDKNIEALILSHKELSMLIAYSPIYDFVKSLFITDLIDCKTIKNEITTKLLSEIINERRKNE